MSSALYKVAATANKLEKVKEQKELETGLANAKAQYDPTPALLGASEAAAEDGSDIVELTRDAYSTWLDETSDQLENDDVRVAFRNYWNNRAGEIFSKAAEQSVARRNAYDKQQVGVSLTSLENRVRVDPSAYDDALALGNDVIATYPAFNNSGSKTAWARNVAKARFDGQLDEARSTDDLDALREELKRDDWQSRLTPEDFDSVVDSVESKRAKLRTAAVASARTNVNDLASRTDSGEVVTRDELQAANDQVTEAGDVQLASKLARTARDQMLLGNYKGQHPTQIKARAAEARSRASDVPEAVEVAVNEATAYSSGQVSASYLSTVAKVEYGGEMASGDYGVQASTSSATGLFQFTKGTWLDVVRDAGDALVPGSSDMSDEELLAMRSDPVLSAKAASVLAINNRTYLEGSLGRGVSDAETYMAHLLGPAGADALIRAYQMDETLSAEEVFPREAKANPGLFYGEDNQSVTIGELYNGIAGKFVAAPGRAAYEDAEFLDKLATSAERKIKDNMMGYAREAGIVQFDEITDQDSVRRRAQAAKLVSDTWRVPLNQVKPLEPAEVNKYQNVMAGDNPDAKLETMALFDAMGPVLSQAAYKQLGAAGNVYGHASGLLWHGGDGSAAYDVVRGQTFIDNNPEYATAMQLNKADVVDQFGGRISQLVGSMGSDAATGSAWQTTLDAAYAHYVQTHTRQGNKGVDADAFEASLNYVLGGSSASPVLGEVNGVETVLPVGVRQDALEDWMYYSDVNGWAALSTTGLAPKYLNGDTVDAADLRNNATLEAVGSGVYRVKLDGQYLTTGRANSTGRSELYTIRINAGSFNSSVERVRDAVSEVKAQEAELPAALARKERRSRYSNVVDELGGAE